MHRPEPQQDRFRPVPIRPMALPNMLWIASFRIRNGGDCSIQNNSALYSTSTSTNEKITRSFFNPTSTVSLGSSAIRRIRSHLLMVDP